MEFYENWAGANKVFRWANCFQQVAHNEPGWDAAYCTEVLIIGFLSLVNALLLSYLLYIDINKQKSKAEVTWHKEFFKRSKSWILILGILMNTLQFIRNFLQPNLLGFMFNGTLYICEGLKFCIFMFVFYYFLKQSASLLTGDTVKSW